MDDKDKLKPQQSKATFFSPRAQRLQLKDQTEDSTPYAPIIEQNKLLSPALRKNAVRWKKELVVFTDLQRAAENISSQSPNKVGKATAPIQELDVMPFLKEGNVPENIRKAIQLLKSDKTKQTLQTSSFTACINEVKKIAKIIPLLDETKGSLQHYALFIPWMPLREFVKAVTRDKFDKKLLAGIFNTDILKLSKNLKILISVSQKHLKAIEHLVNEEEALQKWMDDIGQFQSELKDFKSSDDKDFFKKLNGFLLKIRQYPDRLFNVIKKKLGVFSTSKSVTPRWDLTTLKSALMKHNNTSAPLDYVLAKLVALHTTAQNQAQSLHNHLVKATIPDFTKYNSNKLEKQYPNLFRQSERYVFTDINETIYSQIGLLERYQKQRLKMSSEIVVHISLVLAHIGEAAKRLPEYSDSVGLTPVTVFRTKFYHLSQNMRVLSGWEAFIKTPNASTLFRTIIAELVLFKKYKDGEQYRMKLQKPIQHILTFMGYAPTPLREKFEIMKHYMTNFRSIDTKKIAMSEPGTAKSESDKPDIQPRVIFNLLMLGDVIRTLPAYDDISYTQYVNRVKLIGEGRSRISEYEFDQFKKHVEKFGQLMGMFRRVRLIRGKFAHNQAYNIGELLSLLNVLSEGKIIEQLDELGNAGDYVSKSTLKF